MCFFISFKKTLPTSFRHIRCDIQKIFIPNLNRPLDFEVDHRHSGNESRKSGPKTFVPCWIGAVKQIKDELCVRRDNAMRLPLTRGSRGAPTISRWTESRRRRTQAMLAVADTRPRLDTAFNVTEPAGRRAS